MTTQAGDVGLRIPKLRKGSFFPSILAPRRRIDQALYAVVMEAYVTRSSTRSVDDLVDALGATSGIKKSEVSRICAGLDETVGAFRTRRTDHTEFPYVYLDATYLHVRNQSSQVASMAVVIATGITATGEREVLGVDVDDSEYETLWRGFLRSLRSRRLDGVRMMISDNTPASSPPCAACFRGCLASTLPRPLLEKPRFAGPDGSRLRRSTGDGPPAGSPSGDSVINARDVQHDCWTSAAASAPCLRILSSLGPRCGAVSRADRGAVRCERRRGHGRSSL